MRDKIDIQAVNGSQSQRLLQSGCPLFVKDMLWMPYIDVMQYRSPEGGDGFLSPYSREAPWFGGMAIIVTAFPRNTVAYPVTSLRGYGPPGIAGVSPAGSTIGSESKCGPYLSTTVGDPSAYRQRYSGLIPATFIAHRYFSFSTSNVATNSTALLTTCTMPAAH